MTLLTRRTMLAMTGATLLAGRTIRARAEPARRTLVLLKLAGGNDGLNTIVPYGDDAYRRARPVIGLDAQAVVPLGQGLGLHPGLAGLEDAWADGDMAIVRGIGYTPADRSHFRSMDVWETAGAPGAPRPDGWLSRVLAGSALPASPLSMLVIGSDPMVAVAGGNLTAFTVSAEAAAPRPLALEAGMATSAGGPVSPALTHILAVERRLALAQAGLADSLTQLPDLATAFPDTDLGRRLRVTAQTIAAGPPAPVILVPVTGFDTHAGQRPVHDALLAAIGAGVAAFRQALIEADCWKSTMLATYSEFGRRLHENSSGGTDHGAAAPHFVLGGDVAGGWVGAMPSLTMLQDSDPVPTTDFRAYLGGLGVAGLGLNASAVAGALGGKMPLALSK